MPVITVSGSLASGAREIAQAAARELALDYVDQEILVEAARQLGVSVTEVADHDERTANFRERLAGIMRAIMERSAAAGAADPAGGAIGLDIVLGRTYGEAAELGSDEPRGVLTDDSYIKTLTTVIKGVAARGDVIILGRGSQAILQHEPQTMHVYVAASRDWRIENLMRRDGVSRPDAEHRLEKSDHQRQQFHRRYFKVDADSPQLYDLGINAGRIRVDVAAGMIAVAARELAPRPG